MNTKKENATLPKNITINTALAGKYNDEPLFKEKADRANLILKTAGIPKFEPEEKKGISSDSAKEEILSKA